jgi:Acetyltransferase (GNAT) family
MLTFSKVCGVYRQQLILLGKVMWITQLVVHHDHRGLGYASTLLRALITSRNPLVVGVASSHPHGILALKRASKSLFDEDFIKAHVRDIYTLCNITYLADKSLVGSMFGTIPHVDKNTPKALINSEFHTDHREPLEALVSLPVDVHWPLGPLLDGHEFIVAFEVGTSRKRTSQESRRTESVVG